MADGRQILMANVHELNENKNDNIWNMSTADDYGVAPETGSSYNFGWE